MNVPKGGVLFFDSGIGGLTVLAECKKRLPYTTFYYYNFLLFLYCFTTHVCIVKQHSLICCFEIFM